ncbi:MAG: helix-turn-helix transcriptional regulator [Christensenellaceae bacterium]|nr:helix-turn-helix transcriptional regulator [Christensenellaceae bacterium]
MHDNPDRLSSIVKAARQRANITIEKLAEKIGVTERYLYRLENENRKPSYDVLFKLIRELGISPDLVFYPEKPSKDSEVESLVRMLYNCDERSMEIIKATVKAALDGQQRESLS